MLKKYIKLSDILIIAILCVISYPCFGQNYYTSSADFPQAQFRSTSAMSTTYTVPQLNNYGTATYPSYSSYRGSMRKVCSCGCEDGCPCCSGGSHESGFDTGDGHSTGSACDCPIGDIDLITILLMLGLGLTIKHTRNKQNSI